MSAYDASPDAELSSCQSTPDVLQRWHHQVLLQAPSTLRGFRPYIAFPLHLWALLVPSAGREDTIPSLQGTVRSHGAGGYTNAKRHYFPGAEAEA